MKTVLEPEDIQAIADAVAARLSQSSPAVPVNRSEDEIFDVPGLAVYLKVEKTWVYRQIQNKAIPLFYVGRYPRFHKSKIDKWNQQNAMPVVGAVSQAGKLKPSL